MSYQQVPSGPPGLPHHRTIVVLDIERSTSRPDPVKAALRSTLYEGFEAALTSAGIHHPLHRDPFRDLGDGLLALIHPVAQAPKALLLTQVIPELSRRLADYNANLPHLSRPQRRLRVRAVVHAGEVSYDRNGCFGEALDVAFRLLGAVAVKKELDAVADPLVLVVSGDIYACVVRQGYDGIDQCAFGRRVRVQIGQHRHWGWVQVPGTADRPNVTDDGQPPAVRLIPGRMAGGPADRRRPEYALS
jgi:class 3 adenylate cyclase